MFLVFNVCIFIINFDHLKQEFNINILNTLNKKKN
jgi:hypothetical protein